MMNMLRFKVLTPTSTRKIKTKTHDVLYVWHALTDASDIVFKRTTEKKQALKMEEGKFYVIKKFGRQLRERE